MYINIVIYIDGSLLYERVPNKPDVDRLTLTPPQPQSVIPTQQNILKRPRQFDEVNGSDGKFHNTIPTNRLGHTTFRAVVY